LEGIYSQVLPNNLKKSASKRQIDAFNLFLYSCDLGHVSNEDNNKHFKLTEDDVKGLPGKVEAIKFRGTYYKFNEDENLVSKIFPDRPPLPGPNYEN
jgi:hypothetical protein